LGLVLRLGINIDEQILRATVKQTYERIVTDLKEAADLLPLSQPFQTRPSKAAAYAALARVYLSMRDYPNAEIYADLSLGLKNTLLDYNTLNAGSGLASFSMPLQNPEILFLAAIQVSNMFDDSRSAKAVPALIQSYQSNDLRRTICYASDGTNNYWRGSYATGWLSSSSIFNGLATDEVYLIRAETRIKNGKVNEGMIDLNTVLRKRWKTGTFSDLTAIDATDALNKVRVERRKSLIFRGLRWSDLRRYNLEGANITLTRTVNGNIYTLPPNDNRWTLMIPELEIQRSGIQQNPR
jgi:hypothetical protein